jgi:UDP-N-acetylmuramoyl-tripeptide--D-alanyl-D-alanine ligase
VKLPIHDAIAATRAHVLNAAALPDALLVQTDTRAIERGATFLALRGERFDGHCYVDEAFARGAACAIVDDPDVVPEGRAALVVADTLQAYLDLGALARTRIRGTVVGITGSTGKTTTKQFLLALLRGAAVPASATPENENNEIGVAKFLCGLDDGDERVAIVEMGARKYRDLDVLVAAARPDVGVLTNIGEAHLEIMGSRERIAETKWALPSGSRSAVLNLADEASRARAASLASAPMWYGIDEERAPNGQRAVVIERDAAWTIAADGTTETHHIAITFPGDHNRRNLAAAFAAALLCIERVPAHANGNATADFGTAAKADFAAAANAGPAAKADFAAAALARAVGTLTLPHGRYEVVELANDVRLVFDAYNASLSGTLATLATFGREECERRIAVLGSMAELGTDAPLMHEKIGEIAAKRAHVVLAGGTFAADTARGVERAGGNVYRYASNDAAIAWLREHLRSGDAILLKGSRVYKMEQIAEALGAEVFA